MAIDEEQAKSLATQFLGQYHNVISPRAASIRGLGGRQEWKLAVHTTQEIIDVTVDAEDGKILGYTTRL